MMPTPNELVDSMRAILRDIVMPDLSSDLARARLRQVMSTLRDVDWQQSGLAALEERGLLAKLASELGIAPPESATPPTSFLDLDRENSMLRQRIAEHFLQRSGTAWTELHRQAAVMLGRCASASTTRRV
jgi:hypothetical protein